MSEYDYAYDPDEKETVSADTVALEARLKAERMEVVASVMRTAAGRKWMWDLLNLCGVRTVSAVPQDPYSTYFNSGQQAIGHFIEAQIMEAAADMYLAMCAEGASVR